jgi:DNA-directed RNA polymerase subunit RPC12/RpoP
MAGRSRFRSEDDADEMIQASYAKVKVRKTKFLFYTICGILALVLAITGPFFVGAKLEPLYYPIWPMLLFPLIFGVVAIAGGTFFNYKIVNETREEFERGAHIKKVSDRSLLIMVIAIVFTIFFFSISAVFPSSWLEEVVMERGGTYEQTVSGWSAADFSFKANDEYAITTASIKVEVVGNNSCDFFIGKYNVFKDIDIENVSDVEGSSLPGAWKYNTTKFKYNGDNFEAGKQYIIRMYNYAHIEDTTVKIYIHRDIDEGLIWGVTILWIVFAALAGMTFGLMQGRKKVKIKAPVRERGPARARSRSAADMFKDMEGEVEEMFGPSAGFRDARLPPEPEPAPAARRRPAAGRRRPGVPATSARARASVKERARAAARARAAERARPAAREPELEMEPEGEKKTISCPRCKTRFSYIKIEGQVTEIKCPKCGKRGRVGAKKARGPPPARARPRPPKREVPSPLDSIMEPAAPVRKKTLACPRCKKKFTVEEKPRPFDIECPHCGKTGTLR